ncbi:hypothetical protein HK104_004245 [Borealophlyctis nickersoniae]|nr:hypothetical protein HK104_004245 [Borealophlyctis nickersoniae]
MALIKTTFLTAALLFLLDSPHASARLVGGNAFPDDMYSLVHCTDAKGQRTSELWGHSSRNNSIFGKPDLMNIPLSKDRHLEYEGHTQLLGTFSQDARFFDEAAAFVIAEGAASVSPGTLVGGGNFAPSACYRGNGDLQSDGNGRRCQQLYNCYLEPDIVLTYNVGSLVEPRPDTNLPSSIIGIAVDNAMEAAGIPEDSPFPGIAGAEVDIGQGYHARVTFKSNGDVSGALTKVLLTGRIRGGTPEERDERSAWCHAWGGCDQETKRPQFLAWPGSSEDTLAPQRFAANVVQGVEKTNGAGFFIEIIDVSQFGKPDCSKFNPLSSGILNLIGTVAGILSPAVGKGLSKELSIITGSLGLANTVCTSF